MNAAAQQADPNSLFYSIKRMITTRKENPVLGEGSAQFLPSDNQAILAILRQSNKATALAIHNVSGESQTVRVDLSDFAGHMPEDLLGRKTDSFPEIKTTPYTISLKAFDYYWLKLK